MIPESDRSAHGLQHVSAAPWDSWTISSISPCPHPHTNSSPPLLSPRLPVPDDALPMIDCRNSRRKPPLTCPDPSGHNYSFLKTYFFKPLSRYIQYIDKWSSWLHPTRHSSLSILQYIVMIDDEIISHGPYLWSQLSASFAPFPAFDFNQPNPLYLSCFLTMFHSCSMSALLSAAPTVASTTLLTRDLRAAKWALFVMCYLPYTHYMDACGLGATVGTSPHH